MTTRRKFIKDIGKTSVLSFLPLSSQILFVNRRYHADTLIDAVDILHITGPFRRMAGVNDQPQIRQSDIYPELRTPAPYQDRTDAKEITSDITHIYIRI